MNTPDNQEGAGYWRVVCGGLLPEEGGVIVHDAVPHPDFLTFAEEENPQ